MNKPPYGNNIRLLDPVQQFKVSAQDMPNKTVKIAAGTFISGSGNIIEFNGANSAIINSPTTGSLWYLISIGPTANVVLTSGTTPPVVAKNHLACALLFIKSTDTVITNDMIFDVRPLYDANHYGTAHNELSNTTIPDCHPISAITGLTDILADKVSNIDFNNALLNKSDLDGTISQTFILNKDQTGTPAENVEILVERGNATNVGIRWNETNTRWEFTNDGADWFAISNSGYIDSATTTVAGTVLLSVAPVDPADAIVVGDNDPRLLTIQQQTNLLSHLTNTADPHNVLASMTAADVPAHDHVSHGGALGANTVGASQITAASIVDAHLADELKYTLVRKSSTDVVSNTLTFNPTAIGVPFVIGANAAGQLIAGLNAELFDGKVSTEFASSTHNHNGVYITPADITVLETMIDATYAPVAHTHPSYALASDFLSIADAATTYAPKQPGVSGTFTTVDSKTITIVDGVVTSIV